MECLRFDPAHIRRELPHLVAELGNPVANGSVDIESHEEAHTITSASGAPGRAPAGWPSAEYARGLRESVVAQLRFSARWSPRYRPARQAFPLFPRRDPRYP